VGKRRLMQPEAFPMDALNGGDLCNNSKPEPNLFRLKNKK